MKRWSLLVLLLCVIWGCSSDDVVKIEPAPLPNFSEEVSLETLWSANVGDGLGEKFTRIKPAVLDSTIFVASIDGDVMAFNRLSGAKRWEVNVDTPISGGVGAGENTVFVTTLNGELIALNAENGSTQWRVPTSSEVLSVPQVDSGVVVIQSNDDVVSAFSVNDGAQRWIYNDTTPALTVRGTASPLIFQGAAVVGLANGRVVVINMNDGSVVWDRAVSAGEGRTELDRLNDVDGTPALNQNGLFVGNYQGHLAAFDPRSSEIKWQNDASVLVTPVVDNSNVYVTDAESHVFAFDQSSGSPMWSTKELDNRSVTAPQIFGNYLAVADFEGYVHLMSIADGHFAGRGRADSSGVRVQPLVVDDVMYVYGNSGKLTAYRMANK